MTFLPNARFLSFYTYFCQDCLSYEEKLKYIKQLFSALQYLHNYIVIGDIHADNLIISNGKAYIIDLDDARKKGNPKIVWYAYYVKPFEFVSTSIYTDITKLYLESLSFILDISIILATSIFGICLLLFTFQKK